MGYPPPPLLGLLLSPWSLYSLLFKYMDGGTIVKSFAWIHGIYQNNLKIASAVGL